jgi:hypothetical protein
MLRVAVGTIFACLLLLLITFSGALVVIGALVVVVVSLPNITTIKILIQTPNNNKLLDLGFD